MKALIALLFLISCSVFGQGADGVRAVLDGAQSIKDGLKKPESFKLISAFVVAPNTMCFEYTARNSFNDQKNEIRVMSGKLNSAKNTDWNKFCADKPGLIMTDIVRSLVK